MATDRRPRRLIFIALGIVALGLFLWAVLHKKTAKPVAPQPIPVTAAKVTSRDLATSITALGAAQAWTSDTILAQVSGKLIRVNFAEGSEVRAGQVLAEVDPAPYRAVLDQALGTLHRDEAILSGARRDLARYRGLQHVDAIARQTVEDQSATVAQDEGTVQLDRGSVAAARVNLRWCTIISPISGRVGVRLVDPGNLVSASGSTASTPSTAAATNSTSPATTSGSGIVVVNQIEPIAVTFTVPQGEFGRLVRISNGFRKPLAVEAHSQETGALLDTGELRIADNKVDPATGTVEFKARFANPARHLWPGQFVDVRLATETLPNATVIPVTAVNRGPNGQFAFVVAADGHIAMRTLKPATTQGDMVAIASGVRPGELVVTDGQMTLKPNSTVRVVRLAPPNGTAS